MITNGDPNKKGIRNSPRIFISIKPFYKIPQNPVKVIYFNESDYYLSRLTTGVDFRAKNLEAFDSLEKNSIDFYASV